MANNSTAEVRKIVLPGNSAQQMRTIAMSMALDAVAYNDNPPGVEKLIDIAVEIENYIKGGKK